MNPAASYNQKEDRSASRRRMILMVLVALALRLAVVSLPSFEDLMAADHIHTWDQGNVARSLVAGRGFGSSFDSGQPSASLPPVYPLIVAAFFLVFGVHTAHAILAIHVFDCLINAMACIPIYLLARRSFGERVGRWAAWAWVFFPYGIYFSAAWAWSTHLLLLSLCWLLYLAQDLEQSPRLGLWAGFGVLAGFAGLTESSILVVIPFLLALAAWRLARLGKPWLLPGVVASLTLAAVISPWMIRDAMVFHRFIPMRGNMGLELWLGNNGHNLHWSSYDLSPMHNQNELAEYNRMGEVAYMDNKARLASAYIHDHPGWYAWMCVRRAVYLWTGYWSFNRDYLALEPMDPANIPFATSLTLLAIAGLVLAWRRNKFDAIRYGGVMFLFPLTYYFAHPEPYHLRPLDPLLTILGCFAILKWRGLPSESAEIESPAAHQPRQPANA